MRLSARFISIHLLSLCAVVFISERALANWVKDSFSAMGTVVDVELWMEDRQQVAPTLQQIRLEIQRLEALLSPYIETSDISRVNAFAYKQPVAVAAETYKLIQRSLYFSRLSAGAFDISFASVGQHYDYRKREKPAKELIEQQQALMDFNKLSLSQSVEEGTTRYYVAFEQANMSIDLGGIAKGYTVDRVLAQLRSAGVVSAAISIGGDSGFLGDRGPVPESTQLDSTNRIPWMVGIKHPRGEANQYALRMPLVDIAFSTSGDYERFFVDSNGERVHHILDPSTGRSASKLVSVSVLGPSSMDCDALSTTLFVLGVEKGIELIETLAGYDAVLIDTVGKVHYSNGLR